MSAPSSPPHDLFRPFSGRRIILHCGRCSRSTGISDDALPKYCCSGPHLCPVCGHESHYIMGAFRVAISCKCGKCRAEVQKREVQCWACEAWNKCYTYPLCKTCGFAMNGLVCVKAWSTDWWVENCMDIPPTWGKEVWEREKMERERKRREWEEEWRRRKWWRRWGR